MQILFPSRPGERRTVDPSFAEEHAAAVEAGFEVALVNEGAFDSPFELYRLRQGSALYRGWLMPSNRYRRLAETVSKEGAELVVSPDAFKATNELPSWYPALANVTPRSLWSEGPEVRDAFLAKVGSAFGDRPVLVKDYVKSRKHEWFDACYVRSATEPAELRRVLQNLVRLQEDAFVGGIVVREFVNLISAGIHPKSRMPLPVEYRAFFWMGKLLALTPYWSDGVMFEGPAPDTEWIEFVARNVSSPFFSLDVALRNEGTWTVIETGDGGASGLPDRLSRRDFYHRLRERVSGV